MHRVKTHGGSHPSAEDPYILSLKEEIQRLKLEVSRAELEKRLPQAEPKSSVPSMSEIMFADWIEAKTQAIKSGSSPSSANPLAAEVAELRSKLADRDRDFILGKIEALEKRQYVPSSSEKVEFARVIGDIADRVTDKISRKLDPAIAWFFTEEPSPKELAPSAESDRLDLFERVKSQNPDWVKEG